MRRILGDRLLMVVEEMPNSRIAANQHELLSRRALTEGLQQPEESLDRHVHNGFRDLLACRQVYDMRHVAHRAIDAAAVFDASFDDLYSIGLRDGAAVTQRPHPWAAPAGIGEQLLDEIDADLSCRSGNQKLHRSLPPHGFGVRWVSGLGIPSRQDWGRGRGRASLGSQSRTDPMPEDMIGGYVGDKLALLQAFPRIEAARAMAPCHTIGVALRRYAPMLGAYRQKGRRS
jgi:hypothetical protein